MKIAQKFELNPSKLYSEKLNREKTSFSVATGGPQPASALCGGY
jgi:hypothetical protein